MQDSRIDQGRELRLTTRNVFGLAANTRPHRVDLVERAGFDLPLGHDRLPQIRSWAQLSTIRAGNERIVGRTTLDQRRHYTISPADAASQTGMRGDRLLIWPRPLERPPFASAEALSRQHATAPNGHLCSTADRVGRAPAEDALLPILGLAPAPWGA